MPLVVDRRGHHNTRIRSNPRAPIRQLSNDLPALAVCEFAGSRFRTRHYQWGARSPSKSARAQKAPLPAPSLQSIRHPYSRTMPNRLHTKRRIPLARDKPSRSQGRLRKRPPIRSNSPIPKIRRTSQALSSSGVVSNFSCLRLRVKHAAARPCRQITWSSFRASVG